MLLTVCLIQSDRAAKQPALAPGSCTAGEA
jgi:hypothetical protein